MRYAVESYLALEDADGFVGRLRRIFSGGRGHYWMYDSGSLAALLVAEGFVEVATIAQASSRIPDPGALDLHEREGGTVCIEARRP